MIGSSKEWEIYGDDVLIAHYIPVRIGTTVELLDLANWQFAQRTGTLTAGADIPYSQLCPDIIEVNTGDLEYGWYGDNMVWFDRPDAIKLDANFTNGHVATNNDRTAMFIPVTGGKTYSFLVSNKLKTDGWYLTQYIADTVEIGTDYSIDGVSTFVNRKGYSDYTLTTDSRTKWIGISLSEAKAGTDTYFNQQFMMVEGGTVPSAIVPKVKGVYTEGQHKLIVRGVNLLNDANVVNAYDAGGNYVYHGYFVSNEGVSYKQYTPSEKYRTAHLVVPAGTYSFFTDTPNFHPLRISVGSAVMAYTTQPVRIATTETTEIQVCWRNDDTTEFSGEHSMIVEGSVTPTVYQPYIAPIIRNIPTLYSEDSFCDTQLDANNKSEAVAVKVLDGTENWTLYSGTNANQMNISLLDCKSGTSENDSLVTHFDYSSGSITNLPNGCYKLAPTAYNMMFRLDGEMTDVATWKAYLAEQYAKGTPVIVLYPLATPAISSAAVESVTVPEGTITVTEECGLRTKGEVQYYSRGVAV